MEAHDDGIKAAQFILINYDELFHGEVETIHEIIRAYLEASNQVLVPVDPTEDMRKAWNCFNFNSTSYFSKDFYAAMIEAAPQPFPPKQDNTTEVDR